MDSYLAYNLNEDIRKKSSSGGVFYSLAKYILDNNGIVFGAAWNKDWLVDMCYVDKLEDLPKLMGSKYISPDAKNTFNTFKECKDFLDSGKLVLYSGLPCQLHGLKLFLKKEYENLLLVDIACHGTMPLQIWKDYLETIKRPDVSITSINFRLKEPDWNNYAFEVKYSDGKALKEHHRKNKYMQAFLSDKYLKLSCYNCKFKNNFSIADINIGDAWGANINWEKKNGISFIRCYTSKGKELLNKVTNLKLTEYNYSNMPNGCLKNKLSVKPEKYNKDIFKKKVGIITTHLHSNFGGILQAYALQRVIKNLGYNCTTLGWKDSSLLKFAYNNLSLRLFDSYKDYNKINENDYDIFVVGSDQIWRKHFNVGDFKENYLFYPFLGFTNNWQSTRVSYAASVGVAGNDWEYNSDEELKIKEMLKYFNNIAVRELQSVDDFKNRLKLDNVNQVVDPTLLLKSSDYTELCSDIPKNNADIFAYFLDLDKNKQDILLNYANKLNKSIKINDNDTIEKWLASFRDAKYIITDSFHGCLFSIIFNKPFICLYNKWRGGARFESLLALLDNNENIIYNIEDLNAKVFKKIKYNKLQEKINYSLNYLAEALAEPKVIMTANQSVYPQVDKPKEKQKTYKSKAVKTKTKKQDNYLYF